MGEAFITRRGGTAVGTAAPSINFVSSTFDSITFTITNNDALTADIFWEIGDNTPDANTLSLAGGATSSNQVASGLDAETSYTIFAFANAEGKAGSQTSSIAQTTPVQPIVYTAATGGTTLEYDDGGTRYKSHTFTSDGTFTVSTVGDAAGDRNKVDYLIIAGGGAGGRTSRIDRAGGGGGAGGYRTTNGTSGEDSLAESKVVVTAQVYSVNVGAGATAPTENVLVSDNGTNSSALSITSIGGGGGANEGTTITAAIGGSGGGGGARGFGGAGTSNQGFSGGDGAAGSGNRGGGGGGGAGSVGESLADSVNEGGLGGIGLANTLRDGTSETRATGGQGSDGNQSNNVSGTANTGNGGGGSRNNNTPGAGGSGIVVIRYEIAPSV